MAKPFNPTKLRFLKLPFYEIVETVIEPRELAYSTTLAPAINDQAHRARYSQTISFRLRIEHVCVIGLAANWDATQTLSSNDRFPVQLLARICKADDSTEQPELYPANFDVNVNGLPIALPELVQSHRANVDNRRAPLPFTITEQCYLHTQRDNRITITWTDEQPMNPVPFGTRFCFAVYLARRLKPDWLLTQIEEREHFSAPQTFSLLTEMFTETDDHIAATEICCSLRCTLSSTRIRVPVRSVRCSHIQCFDATNWLEVNARNPKWICPVCNQPVPFDSIRVDDFMRKLLADPDHRRDDEVQFGAANLDFWRSSYVDAAGAIVQPQRVPSVDRPASADATTRSIASSEVSTNMKGDEQPAPAAVASRRGSENSAAAIDLTDD